MLLVLAPTIESAWVCARIYGGEGVVEEQRGPAGDRWYRHGTCIAYPYHALRGWLGPPPARLAVFRPSALRARAQLLELVARARDIILIGAPYEASSAPIASLLRQHGAASRWIVPRTLRVAGNTPLQDSLTLRRWIWKTAEWDADIRTQLARTEPHVAPLYRTRSGLWYRHLIHAPVIPWMVWHREESVCVSGIRRDLEWPRGCRITVRSGQWHLGAPMILAALLRPRAPSSRSALSWARAAWMSGELISPAPGVVGGVPPWRILEVRVDDQD
ncbi:MAG: hypothetical protein NZM07_09790, partial [Elioraea sp.]|nr:hypothetical protein [Elioraea sp.]